jgi:class 3 adenylate cyclase
MRAAMRPFLLLLFGAMQFPVHAQTLYFPRQNKDHEIGLGMLRKEDMALPGHGQQVPGMVLKDVAPARHLIGDDIHGAERERPDSLWADLGTSLDSVVPGQGVHWIRYRLSPLDDLRKVPLLLHIGAHAPFEVFLNGRSVLRSPGMGRVASSAGLPTGDSLLLVAVPFTFLCDGRPEVIAVRVVAAPGGSLRSTGYRGSVQLADAAYDQHRRMMHFGVFIGINVVILILAFVIWFSDRRERSWLLLALFSLVSALDTFSEVGTGMGALGFSGMAARALMVLNEVLVPWPLYLLVMVLGALRGDLGRRRARWYTISVLTLTLICAATALAEIRGIIDNSAGFTFTDDRLMVPVIVLGGVFALVMGWFIIVVVRLAIGLLRSKGYARWVGGGALASVLLSIVLRLIGAFVGTGFSRWLALLGDYCSYVAVPVSIAVYLAVRSAQHSRLVARQRDELDQEVKERTAQLSAEKDRSEELLLNILPAEVAEELKRTGAAEARHFDAATVMFTDFKGFTSLAEQVDPAELLRELNACFKAFDDIIGAHGVEKIKTIGDSYMCVGGLPDPKSATPADVVHAALEMQAFMIARNADPAARNGPAFEMRVGIHTGAVVAGIVGVKKFQYDIWGDTVNTASRMESSGETGQVNISGTTYALVKNEQAFTFIPRGKVQAKGKGELEMYFVRRG